MAIKGNIMITTNFYESRFFHTPKWLQECPLEPIMPVDMKTIYIGESLKLIQMDDIGTTFMQARSIYVEIDDYFNEDNYV